MYASKYYQSCIHGNFIQILLHMKLKGLKLIDRLPSNIVITRNGNIKCMIMLNYTSSVFQISIIVIQKYVITIDSIVP